MRTPHIAVLIGAGALALGLSGCNSVDNPIASGPAASIKVDGQDVPLSDTSVGCTVRNGRVHIAVGSDSGTSGVAAVVTEGDNPTVVSVGLGNVDGVTLGYLSNLPMGGSASVKKLLRTYTITGQATGINISNPLQPARKSFEFKVRCP